MLLSIAVPYLSQMFSENTQQFTGQDRAGQGRTRVKHGGTLCTLMTQEEEQKFKVTLNYIETLSQNKGIEGEGKEGRQGKEQSPPPQNLN